MCKNEEENEAFQFIFKIVIILIFLDMAKMGKITSG